jgi:amino acid transporter/nucleotide-binding universal stress UspA family protein
MLFGDWGTSRLYVLGLAFVMSAHASFWYVAAMCALMALVGFSYSIVCAHFPDGGGVYSAAKQRSRSLAVVGALLLVADYVVTAALSAYEGFRYILSESPQIAWLAALMAIIAIGLINIIGPRRVGVLAVIVGVFSVAFYIIIAVFCAAQSKGAVVVRPHEDIASAWSHFINVILALSGVEAIANMTGIMAEPVAKNARKAIFVVLLEVIALNLIMAYAMNALPDAFMAAQSQADKQDHMVKLISAYYVAPWFSAVSSFFFGLLLLSATNTAIGGIVSVTYLLARDKELPRVFTRLNRYGVPWVGLATATAIPLAVLLVVGDDMLVLAGLYAIGVVGAIAINLLACGSNFKLDLAKWERITLLAVGVLVLAIEATIAIEKRSALLFAVLILGAGLLARYISQHLAPALARPAEIGVPEVITVTGTLRANVPPNMPRLLVPSRGNPKLFKFAVNYAKDKKAAVFVLFVREVALAFRERGAPVAAETMTLGNDKEAQKVFADARKLCDAANVPMVPLYAVHDSPAELILDHAATLGADAVLMGVSQRGAVWKTLRGDVLQEVINYLPESIPLLIHA